MDQTPVFRVSVVSRTTRAVNYRHRGGSTTVDIKGTDLMPKATGKAKADSKAGRLQVNVDLSRLGPVSKIGPQYLTYVLWAITPKAALTEVRHGTAEFAICDIESWTSLVFAIAISEKAM